MYSELRYPELRFCINVLAAICVVMGLTLFAGTKRETLWDRNNLVGMLFLGIALSAHGGFETILRSSPRASCSGYVMTWRGGPTSTGSMRSIDLYDLGYPPPVTNRGAYWLGSPYCAVYIPVDVPNAVWQHGWFLRVTYRTRDLQAVRIEGKPLPTAKASGVQEWHWLPFSPSTRDRDCLCIAARSSCTASSQARFGYISAPHQPLRR
jgi:hypothetical protein